jgi:hypothetical protein
MDNLVSLLKSYGPAAVNDEVRNKILELIQTWATATEGRHDLFYIGETYKTLQREGYKFPPRVDVASSMLDSSAVSNPMTINWNLALTAGSHQNGLIRTYACDAVPLSASRIESITVGIVGTCSTSNVLVNQYRYLI